MKIAVAVSEFNNQITSRLLQQCRLELKKQGVSEGNIRVIWVPGAYELPFVAKRLALTKKFDVIICLGCIIKGGTDHDKYVARWASQGIGQASLQTNVPILFGVLSVKNESQALARSKPGPLNRGKEMADAAIGIVELLKRERI